jgi:hypothetical protein
VIRDNILRVGDKECPTLKVPRQCSLVRLVEVHLRNGKALGSEEGKGLGSQLFF